MDARRYAPAAARNREPILGVLQRVLPASGSVLEIASGSGEHAVHFAARLPALTFLPSDPDAGQRASIAASGLPNVRFLYGPYRVAGAHTAESNAAFDARLRADDPRWGVRDVEDVGAAARERGLELEESVPMPANNLSLILRRL